MGGNAPDPERYGSIEFCDSGSRRKASAGDSGAPPATGAYVEGFVGCTRVRLLREWLMKPVVFEEPRSPGHHEPCFQNAAIVQSSGSCCSERP